MTVFVGTSGYSYGSWKGSFYPADLSAKEMLRFYGQQLPAVEINSTFYRLPKASVLQSWAGQVPRDFQFALKASRRITHIKRLKDAAEETGYFVRTARTLGSRLGPLLFQLPPNLRKDTDRLARFLDLLPEETHAAFEFRHPSWDDDDVFHCLADRNCALCASDTGDDQKPRLVRTADWGYLRLRRPRYAPNDLEDWARRVRSQGWEQAYVFFKHEDEGAGPRLAGSFLQLLRRNAGDTSVARGRQQNRRSRGTP